MGEFVKNEESIQQMPGKKEKEGSIMTRKIIFLDVDGTIIDYDNHIPESAVVAIRKAREKGHLVYVCTCLLYTSPSPRDVEESRMPSSA